MHLDYLKSAIVGGWVLAVGAMAFYVSVDSPGGWTIVAALAVIPPIVLLRMWQPPAQTISESIHAARR
ncbi:MAG TPA: hypothetical protein VFJ02_01830 [Vicinamibacterales bacterium]|nr:hypothetical protein [Vicinamibacterales bacterium]